MHFNYIPIEHDINKLQGYLDFLFFEIWIKAEGDFNSSFLEPNKEFYDIYNVLELQETEWGNFFNGRIALIHEEFAKIDNDKFKTDLAESYKANNNIEGLCCNKALVPITYEDIHSVYPDLAKALKSFYSRIYGSTSPFNLKAFGFLNDKLLPDFDTEFMKVNSKEICPFCGINHIKGNNYSTREAYDHFIPKGIYPFNTINFKNLAPMCHECNSTYKLTKKPIYFKDDNDINPIERELSRNLSFYPYSESKPELNFKIELKTTRIDELKIDEIVLEIESEGNEEQVESWKRIFGLDERYKALLCSPSAGIDWYNSIISEYENAEALSDIEGAEQYYQVILKDAKKNLISGTGFIKSVFLETCHEKGLFKKLD
ncbi:hypothetical protein H0I25_11235 [Cellulophaga sp. HaHa_2_95]|uniref:hypothetical protein n=1 Tax=Cellulophaga sp. HaHa_2_95 TaxID=2745558 RepID=UPI001C4F9305|nr:hypothetical protein [Cellulophaga sp. HaHa_2_95]QXP54660.1 hypothetical protein H0I25_11235 [Cellulophaga sp. HaHa_2_95]